MANHHTGGWFSYTQLYALCSYEQVQKLYNDMVKAEYSYSTIELTSVVPGGCMKQALFMEYAKDSYLYNFFAVMLRTGMRCGELRGLKWSDIDRKKNVIHVQRTIKFVKGENGIEDTPKTAASRRDIPLTDDLMKLLEEQRKYWDFKVERIDRYLFCDENGNCLIACKFAAELLNRPILGRVAFLFSVDYRITVTHTGGTAQGLHCYVQFFIFRRFRQQKAPPKRGRCGCIMLR